MIKIFRARFTVEWLNRSHGLLGVCQTEFKELKGSNDMKLNCAEIQAPPSISAHHLLMPSLQYIMAETGRVVRAERGMNAAKYS